MIPSTIKVGSLRYTVGCSAEAIHEYMYNTQTGSKAGGIDFHTLKIAMEPKLALDRRRATLLHEVLHACMQLYGLEGEGDKHTTEDFAECAAILLAVLQENPALMVYLMEGEG